MKRLVATLILTLPTSPVWAVTTLTTGSISMTQSTASVFETECTAVNVSTKPLAVLLVLYTHDGTALVTGGSTLGPQQETAILSPAVTEDLHCTITFSGSSKLVRGAIVVIDNITPLAALPAQ
jgi:hypothetical protein